MQVAGKLGELGSSTLLLTLLLFLANLAIVIVQVTSHLLVLRLNVLQVLFASVEVMLPSTAVVATVAAHNKIKASDSHNPSPLSVLLGT